MAVAKGQIAEGAVKIALTGYEAAKKQLAELGKGTSGIGEKLSSIGKSASVAFAGASATVLSMVSAADPVRFTIFQQQLKILAILIGRMFIPILQKLIEFVNRVNIAVAKMSSGQMETGSRIAKVALVVSGLVSALAFLVKIVGTVIGFLGDLWGVVAPLVRGILSLVRTFGKFLPIGKIIAALTLVFLAFRKEGGRLADIFGRIKEAALPVLEKLWEVAKQVWQVFSEIAGLVGSIFDDLLDSAGSGLLDVFEKLIPLIKDGLNAVKSILDLISSALKEVMGVIKDAKAIYSVLREKKASEIPKAVVQGVGRAATNDGFDLLKKLNPIDALDSTLDDVRDFVKDDLIGGKEDEVKMVEARERLDGKDDSDRGSVSGPGDYGGDPAPAPDPFKPLFPTKGVGQSMGLEDAFKKAQEGAAFDPSKAADMILKLLASGVEVNEEILKATTRPSEATTAF